MGQGSHAGGRVRRTMAVLIVAGLAFALAQTAIIPALGDIARSLHASTSATAWALTGYLLSAAVLTPVFGRLGDMFGERRMLVISLALFAAGGVLAALSPNLGLVIAGRVVQGAGGGVFPLCFAIVREEFPPERRAGSVGLLSAIVGLGAGLGLVGGGLLTDYASWRWIFWAGTIMAAAAALGAQVLVPEAPERTPGKVDVLGAVILAVGLVAPLVAISQAGSWGWGSARTIGLIIAGLAVLAGFVAVEARVASPLVHVPTLASRTVLITNVSTLLVGFGMFGAFLVIPVLAETPVASGYGFGVDAVRAGLILVPGCVVMLMVSPLAGQLGKRVGNKTVLVLGGVVAAAGLGMLAIRHGSQGEVLGWNMLLFVGIGLVFTALPNLIIDAVPAERTGEATGVNALVRSIGLAVGSQVVASILASGVTAAHPLPAEPSYTVAFTVGAVGALVAGAVALAVPRAARQPAELAARVGQAAGRPAQADEEATDAH
jgi:EmrB/QacA subfamily drug resistance transporter